MLHGDPHTWPPSAARQINRIFLRSMGNESSYDRSGYFLQTLWDMIIALIEQIPHTHEAHNTMINLIMELQDLPGDENRI